MAYLIITFVPYTIIAILNVSDETSKIIISIFGTIGVNITINKIIDLRFNNFKYEKDKNIIKLLSYIQSNSYFVLHHLLVDFFSKLK
jgi:hypothetical protein